MAELRTIDRRSPLWDQLIWFIHLRWVAGLLVVIGAGVDMLWLQQYAHAKCLVCIGIAVLIYNALLRAVLPRLPGHRAGQRWLDIYAGVQIGLDVICLTLLTVRTGGTTSPVLGFFVFHMVFASLLLPRSFAYAAVAATVALILAALGMSGHWPDNRATTLALLGWVLTLLFTVYLTSRITAHLRRQRRRLIKQNRRIRRMSHRLRRQQEAMIQHEKMAAMGQMAAGVAHEVANPLASMDSLLQLMQRRPDKPRPEAIDTLRDQVARIKTTLQQMNTFARPGDGDTQRTDINHLIEQGLSMVRFDKRMRGVTIDKQLDPEAGIVQVRTQAIEQVLVNLTINSLDALADTPDPRITITSRGEGGDVIITLADNGPGIPPDDLARIFEPFFTTKPVGKGTGLGLSISYTLIDSHNGRLEAANHPEGGAVFTLTLPRVSPASRERESSAAANPDSGKPDK